MYGATGDGVVDDSAAIKAMLESGKRNFLFKGIYLIDGIIGESFYTFENIDGISIMATSDSKVKYKTNLNYSEENINARDTIFLNFIECKNIDIKLNFEGDYAEYDKLGYYGVVAIRTSSCIRCFFDINAKYCRYVIFNYNQNSDFLSENMVAKGYCQVSGYFFAGTGIKNALIDCETDDVHRSVYLAACENIRVYNIYSNQHTADINVILSTGQLGTNYAGVRNAEIIVKDKTLDINELKIVPYSCGISLQ